MELFNLIGKTAIITGASSGLGERFSRVLADAGARVVLAARRVDRLQRLAATIKNSLVLEMDVSSKHSVQAAFIKLDQLEEKIDICVNNAGIGNVTPIFEAADPDDFEKVIQTNVMGVWYVTKEVISRMDTQKINGSIINIGSICGAAIPSFTGAGYSISKAAVMHLTKALVGELADKNIRINAIVPGFFPTDMTTEILETSGNTILNHIPLGFIGKPSDLDGAILYLASNQASRYVTGSCITVDGGISWGNAQKI